MISDFIKCNNDCVQPYVYSIIALPYFITQMSFILSTLVFQINDSNNLYLLFNLLFRVLLFILIFKLIKWLCTKNYKIIAWILTLLPLSIYVIIGVGQSFLYVNKKCSNAISNAIITSCI